MVNSKLVFSDQAVFDAVPDLLDTLRQRMGNHPAIQDYSLGSQGGPPAGRTLTSRCAQPSEILPVAQALQNHLASKYGVQISVLNRDWVVRIHCRG